MESRGSVPLAQANEHDGAYEGSADRLLRSPNPGRVRLHDGDAACMQPGDQLAEPIALDAHMAHPEIEQDRVIVHIIDGREQGRALSGRLSCGRLRTNISGISLRCRPSAINTWPCRAI